MSHQQARYSSIKVSIFLYFKSWGLFLLAQNDWENGSKPDHFSAWSSFLD